MNTDLEEPRLLLLALGDVDEVGVVVELSRIGRLELLQEDVDFLVSPGGEFSSLSLSSPTWTRGFLDVPEG